MFIRVKVPVTTIPFILRPETTGDLIRRAQCITCEDFGLKSDDPVWTALETVRDEVIESGNKQSLKLFLKTFSTSSR